MLNPEEKIQTYEDEIDLMDYVKVIIKRKKLISAIFLAAIIAAGTFSFLSAKVYKIDTVLEIGKFDEAKIEDSGQLVEKLKSGSYQIIVRKNLGIPEKDYPEVKITNPAGTGLIIREIQSAEIEKAKLVLEEGNKLILEDHQKEIEKKIILINQNIKTTETQIALLENDIAITRNKIKPIDSDIERIENKIVFVEEEKKNLEAKIDALQKILIYQQDPGTQFALFDAKEKLANKKQEIENLYLRINSLQKDKEDIEVEINSLRNSIESLNSAINSLRASLEDIKPTKIIKGPTVSERPVKPRPLLNMAIAGILGLFFGMFWAFCAEWWQKSKNRI